MKRRIDDHQIGVFEVMVLTFTIYILFSLTWQMTSKIPVEVVRLLSFFDFISCVVFLIDWRRRFLMAENRWKYTLYNSLDFVASLPFLYVFTYVGYAKLIRLISIFRIVKIFGGINRVVYYLRTNKIQAAKLLFSVMFMLIMIASPVLILYVEQGIGNIKTAEQALWWSYCTLSTIGYGDFYPVTSAGRILAIFVSIGGISLFGLTSGIIIDYFIKNHTYEKNSDNTENELSSKD